MATIQGVYVALFGRPADPAGLAYFNTVTNNGANLAAINNLAGQKEYTDRFAGQSNVQIVNSIYISLFNRPAEPAGLNFFVDALNKGTLNINNIAIAILDGAQGTDKTILNNKIDAANKFTAALDTPLEIGSYNGANAAASARGFLQTVGATPVTQAQVDAAVVAVGVIGTGGVSLSVAAATLAVSPTATDAVNRTGNGDDTVTVTGTYAGAGTVDGGFGKDTLKVTTDLAGFTPVAAAITNVETLRITSTDGDATAGEAMVGPVVLTNIKGLTAVWNQASVDDFSVSDIADTTVALGLSGNIQGSSTFAFVASKVTGGSDAASLNLESAVVTAGETVTIGSIETLNIAVNGNSTINGLIASAAKTFVATGTGNLNVGNDAAADLSAITSFDASALNGKLNLDLQTGTTMDAAGQEITIKLGALAGDVVTLDTTTSTKDTIVFLKNDASTVVSFDSIVNFASGTDKIDLRAFGETGFTTFANVLEGASFGTAGAATGTYNGTNFLFVDTNNDGKLNLLTDFAVAVTGVVETDVIFA